MDLTGFVRQFRSRHGSKKSAENVEADPYTLLIIQIASLLNFKHYVLAFREILTGHLLPMMCTCHLILSEKTVTNMRR